MPTGALTVLGLLDGNQRIGFGYGSNDATNRYLTYAQDRLPADHRAVVPRNSAFSDLNFALYLGRSERHVNLLIEGTGSALSASSQRAVIVVPFGNVPLTFVATPTGQLRGSLLQRLPWIVAIGGVVLSVAAAIVTQILIRRRRNAEKLAEANRTLFREQLTIAETLQRALLPAQFPDVIQLSDFDLEVAAKYLAGVQALEIGGDWYDVVQQDLGRLTFVVGDVSGRGLPAATVMASLRFAIRGFASEGYTPDVILNKLECSSRPRVRWALCDGSLRPDRWPEPPAASGQCRSPAAPPYCRERAALREEQDWTAHRCGCWAAVLRSDTTAV